MTDPAQALQTILAGQLEDTLFATTSRYYGIATRSLTTPAGREVVYLRRRMVPPPERFDSFQEHTVSEGDRLDNLAAEYLADPELFWRLCDANGAIRPDELTDEPGRRLRITLPEGVSGLRPA